MAALGIDDAERIAFFIEIQIDLLYLGVFGVAEVDGHNAADGGGGLIHQAAGLAKILILGDLSHLGDLDGVEDVSAEHII